MSGAGKQSSGFTYPVVLVAVVVLTITADTATGLSSTLMQREMEKELIFRGLAYRAAIKSYYEAVPGKPAYPRRVEDLLQDPRFLFRRHLRRAYADPTGGKWRFIRVGGRGIAGVATDSERAVLKRNALPDPIAHFAGAKTLREWEFVFLHEKSVTPVAK